MREEQTLPPVVLHVEDEPFHQDLLRLALSSHCEVLSVGNIESAVLALKEEPRIRFVLLDGNLPLGTGGGTQSSVAFFKEHLHNRSDIIVITATCDDKVQKELVSLGCVKSEKHDAWKCVVSLLPLLL